MYWTGRVEVVRSCVTLYADRSGWLCSHNHILESGVTLIDENFTHSILPLLCLREDVLHTGHFSFHLQDTHQNWFIVVR